MNTNKKSVPNLTEEVTSTLEQIPTVSGKIRFLASQNYDRGDISRILNIRYQHVRNVLLQPLKRK